MSHLQENLILLVAGLFAGAASLISFWLIMRHQQNMTNISVQSKIVGIIWMIPIYSIDSFIGLWMPSIADYVNMLRDCYEAYVLYLFLSLMLSYMGCEDEECEFRLITYLEKQPPVKRSCPFNWMCGDELPRGREFLRYCKFGTLQYCVVRPTTTLIAMLLDVAGAYHESELSLHYGYIYILFIMNVSIGYAFIVLASFYTAMKYKLKPYEPVGKFLCIKFVIFFAFWQSVVITGFVKIGWITGFGAHDARQVATGMQDFLICIEMFIAAIAFTYTFSYIPFTEGYVNTKELNMLAAEYDEENQAAMQYFLQATDNDIKADSHRKSGSDGSSAGCGGGGSKKGSKSARKSGVGLLNMMRSTRTAAYPASGAAFTDVTREQGNKTFTSNSKGKDGKNKKKKSKDTAMSKQGNYHLIEMSDEVSAARTATAGAGTGSGASASGEEDVHNNLRQSGGSSTYSNSNSAHHSTSSNNGAYQNKQRSIYSAHTYQPPAPTIAGELLDKHFSASTAIRDFNQTMPVVVLPSGFEMHRGVVVNSDPETRLRALQEEDDNRLQQEQEQEH